MRKYIKKFKNYKLKKGQRLELNSNKISVWDKNDNLVYTENKNGYWEKLEYDKNSNLLNFEDSDGFSKKEYDEEF